VWIVKLGLRRPYTLAVVAILLFVLGGITIQRTPTDILPNIDIPVVSVIWQYRGLSTDEMERRITTASERSFTTTSARDQLALRQQEIRVQQIEEQIRLEIENAPIALDQARATAEAAQQERTYQEQAVTAEIDQLGVGVSTTYLVIQYQRDLAQARSAEVAALASYAKARAAVARVSGRLIETYGISVSHVLEERATPRPHSVADADR
jgi:hypothetical protein